MIPLSQTWDLDTLFPGGSQSSALRSLISTVNHRLDHFSDRFSDHSEFAQPFLAFQELDGHCRDIEYFIECLLSQDVKDEAALELYSQSKTMRAKCDNLAEEFACRLSLLDEKAFSNLLNQPELKPLAFDLKERRQAVKDKLPIKEEKLAQQLAVDGYSGWSELYETFAGQLRIPSPFSDGESLSVGQANNRLTYKERSTRQGWFYRLEESWSAHAHLGAQMLNHLAGFRLNLSNARGCPSILHEPLFINRMQEKTLNQMWKAIDQEKEKLHPYFNCKAKLIGVDKLAWYDVESPLPFENQTSLSFDEAADLIIQDFTRFSPSMGAFAKEAFEKKWIEAEDRSGKRPGGYCSSFLHAGASRIFMTYSGTMNNVLVLAHELGHAYHSYVMRDLPFFSQQYRMNVAETASTLAEMVILDSFKERSKDPRMQLAILDTKLQRSVTYLMNIHARFLFECQFYQERKKGYVTVPRLNAMMEEAQKKAFDGLLSEWHPLFWFSKQHFFNTEVPFYNFPYTFGYLFSQGIYSKLQGRKERDEEYRMLLLDTGRMETEQLALKHLGVKLEEPGFWNEALLSVKKDVEAYQLIYNESFK